MTKTDRFTKEYGPKIWELLYVIAINYPDNPTPMQQYNYLQFYRLLSRVLPRATWRSNWEISTKLIFAKENAPKIHDHKALFKRLFRLHKHYRKDLGQSPMQGDWDDMYNNYVWTLETAGEKVIKTRTPIVPVTMESLSMFKNYITDIVTPESYVIAVIPGRRTRFGQPYITEDELFSIRYIAEKGAGKYSKIVIVKEGDSVNSYYRNAISQISSAFKFKMDLKRDPTFIVFKGSYNSYSVFSSPSELQAEMNRMYSPPSKK
jgi:hypothetical protein